MKQSQKLLRTRQEIADELGISTKTLYRKIKNSGIQVTRDVYLSPAEQKLIYKLFNIEDLQ